MGIRGLTTYILEKAELYLQPFELHDTYLVIDGNALASHLYNQQTKSNCCFGGDYDKFAQTVSEFFDSLTKCNVTSLVLIDGGIKNSKIPVSQARTRKKITVAFNFNCAELCTRKFFPLFMKEVFKEVMSRKKIKYIQTLLEADSEIASVARILNCPVLSSDSDFFVYDVTYIPANTISLFEVDNRKEEGYMKHCKAYKLKYLLQQFQNLVPLHLPLASALLGNDYIQRPLFKGLIKYNDDRHRAETIFNWLSKYSPHTAIVQMLSIVSQRQRKKVLTIIEMIINIYTITEPRTMMSLGFSEEFVTEKMKNFRKQPFKFQEDGVNCFCFDDDSKKYVDAKDFEDEEKDDPEFQYDLNLQKVAPPWFIQEFHSAKFASYFIDILTKRYYICPTQIEDYFYPPAITICTRIVKVIYALLTNGLRGPNSLSYLCRGKGLRYVVTQLSASRQMFGRDLPTLFNLRSLPFIARKRILTETLGITEFAVDSFPNEWKLYVATAIFWMSRQQKPSGTRCHLYSLLFAMLFGIVDKKIGYQRSEQYFRKKYGQQIQAILNHRKRRSVKQLSNMDILMIKKQLTITEAYRGVTEDDCLLIAPFLLSNFEIDSSLFPSSRKFDVSIVHAFVQFQICLSHCLHLNALLGDIYERPNVSEMFNGTLVYNLYTKLKKSSDIDAYVFHQLQYAPSLSILFCLLAHDVKMTLRTDVLDTMNTSSNFQDDWHDFTDDSDT